MTDHESRRKLRVFLCHSSDDKARVRTLYERLVDEGFAPWLDEKNLLPGQEWDREIRRAVRSSDAVIVCLSKGSITKEGYVQKEIRLGLDVADEKPEGAIFLIPLRLEVCSVPDRLARWQWVDLFHERGVDVLMESLRARAISIGLPISGTAVPQKIDTGAPRPEDDNRLVITLDPDFDFIGGDEGAQTAAYRFLSAARNEQQVQVILKCDAVGIAAATMKQLQSQTKRTPDEEWRLCHTMKIQEHCAEAASLFSRSFNYVWYRSQFKHELFLSLEESLAELLIGLRDRLFRSAPMLPDHTETPEWSKAMRQRTVQLFAWHVDHPERYLIVDLTTEELKGLEDYYHRWTDFDFSESSACHANGLPMKALQRAVAPTIALDLVKRFKPDNIDENLSDLTHWLVGASHPDKALSRFTWEEMTRKQSGK
jgi:hypothetical protein